MDFSKSTAVVSCCIGLHNFGVSKRLVLAKEFHDNGIVEVTTGNCLHALLSDVK